MSGDFSFVFTCRLSEQPNSVHPDFCGILFTVKVSTHVNYPHPASSSTWLAYLRGSMASDDTAGTTGTD